MDDSEKMALVGQGGGIAQLVSINQEDGKGKVEDTFSHKHLEGPGFGANFIRRGELVLFGSIEGCALLWDRNKAAVVCGLDHGEGISLFGRRSYPSQMIDMFITDEVEAVAVRLKAAYRCSLY